MATLDEGRKSYPIGTVSKWKTGPHVKTDEGWLPMPMEKVKDAPQDIPYINADGNPKMSPGLTEAMVTAAVGSAALAATQAIPAAIDRINARRDDAEAAAEETRNNLSSWYESARDQGLTQGDRQSPEMDSAVAEWGTQLPPSSDSFSDYLPDALAIAGRAALVIGGWGVLGAVGLYAGVNAARYITKRLRDRKQAGALKESAPRDPQGAFLDAVKKASAHVQLAVMHRFSPDDLKAAATSRAMRAKLAHAVDPLTHAVSARAVSKMETS